MPAGAVVRVRAADGQVVGGGFLVGPGVVATCAHVVADAAGADAYDPAPPTVPVRLDFPLLDGPDGDQPQVRGTVERWVPIADDGTGDVALLRLDGPLPEHARMPPLRRIERLWGHGFRVLGFPDGAWDGVPAPTVDRLVGFDADGYLAVAVGGGDRVDLLDVGRGVVSGSLGFPFRMDEEIHDGRTMTVDATRVGDLALDVAVTAADWSARLCAVAARPFTDAELAILPSGVGTAPPCP